MFRRLWPLILMLAVGLAACSPAAATPRVISSFPQNGNTYTAPNVPPLSITYNTALEIAVADLNGAASATATRAAQLNGYLLSQTSNQNRLDEFVALTVAVPASRFEEMRAWLKGRGTLLTENLYGQVSAEYGDWSSAGYSQITVTFRPNWWQWFGNFALGALGLLWNITPPLLMLIGLITVIRVVINRLRRKP